VLPFPIDLTAGAPIYEQIVEAVRRAIATGRLKEGDRFPSVRAISAELRVNPNTVQKSVAELTSLGLLEVHPGQGCYIAARSSSTAREQREALSPLLERLVVEASHQGVDEATLLELLRAKCRELKIKLD
jgi:GntR family transcriptional regulator